MNPKPLERISQTLRLLLKVNIGVTIFAILVNIYSYYSYSQLPKVVDPNKTFLLSDAIVGIVGLVQFIMFPVLGITFLLWIYRTNKNLHALSSQHMRYSPGWAVGWYFVPIANLFKPYQTMKEIWVISHRESEVHSAILKWWWFLWIISNVIGIQALKHSMRAEDAESFITSTLVLIASDGVDFALSAAALSVVTGIWTAYSRNYLGQNVALDSSSKDTISPLPTKPLN